MQRIKRKHNLVCNFSSVLNQSGVIVCVSVFAHGVSLTCVRVYSTSDRLTVVLSPGWKLTVASSSLTWCSLMMRIGTSWKLAGWVSMLSSANLYSCLGDLELYGGSWRLSIRLNQLLFPAPLGVHCVMVRNAITLDLVKKALEQFSKKQWRRLVLWRCSCCKWTRTHLLCKKTDLYRGLGVSCLMLVSVQPTVFNLNDNNNWWILIITF